MLRYVRNLQPLNPLTHIGVWLILAQIHATYEYIWDAIGSLRPGNLADRFDQISTRFQNGRVNELVRFYVSQEEESSYAQFVLRNEMGLRYSSVSPSKCCLKLQKTCGLLPASELTRKVVCNGICLRIYLWIERFPVIQRAHNLLTLCY